MTWPPPPASALRSRTSCVVLPTVSRVLSFDFGAGASEHPTAKVYSDLVQAEYRERIESLHPTRLAFHDQPESMQDLRIALVEAERKELIRLWRAREIGDETLHEIEHELDLEETLLRR